MDGTATQDFLQEGMAKYEAKAPYPEVIELFQKATEGDKQTKGTAFTCLSWLYALNNEPDKAAKSAKEALRLDRTNAQAHFNLVLAMLASGTKGVRDELQRAMAITTHDALHEAEGNLQEALVRHPDFAPAKKLLGWLAHDDH
jgi:tetratricopeptide (TPR) repeat protein